MTITNRERGAALIAVLWLAAALSAIAFAVATTVRGETERASTHADGMRAYYLASGAVERAVLYMQWNDQYRNPDGSERYYRRGMVTMPMEFPSGSARVDLLPETGKLNINTMPPAELSRLLALSGATAEQVQAVTLGVLDWRTPAPAPTEFDQYYASLRPSFRARHASFEEIEELLLVRGMTPELFYGSYERNAQNRLVPRAGLRDCLSIYGSDRVDVNTAEPVVLATVGLPPDSIQGLVQMRRARPFQNEGELEQAAPFAGPSRARLQVGGGSIWTLRATARLRRPDGSLSDLRRSVAAQVKFLPEGTDEGYHILRWYDNVWTGGAEWR